MNKYPSVTEVLAKYSDFSQVNPDRLEAACNRGTAVHRFACAYARGLWAPFSGEIQGYCQSFQNWFDQYVEKVILTEPYLIDSTHGYDGHLDLLAVLKGDKYPSVIDYKTPVAKNITWAVQCAAYLNLAKKWKPKRSGSLRLRADGKPAIFDSCEEGYRDLQIFLSALFAHKYLT